MSIDKNGGTDSHAPCAVAVSQALRSLRQALVCKRVLVHVSARIHDPPRPLITLAAEAHRPRTSMLARACYPRIARRALGVQAGACVRECSRGSLTLADGPLHRGLDYALCSRRRPGRKLIGSVARQTGPACKPARAAPCQGQPGAAVSAIVPGRHGEAIFAASLLDRTPPSRPFHPGALRQRPRDQWSSQTSRKKIPRRRLRSLTQFWTRSSSSCVLSKSQSPASVANGPRWRCTRCARGAAT